MRMKGRTFIRGLWGETFQESGPSATITLQDTHRKILESWYEFEQPSPCINLTFGGRNTDFLTTNGIPCIELSSSGIVNWSGRIERAPSVCGRVNWGLSFWRHKLECIRTALQFFREVVWLDWDCHMLRRQPDGLWERLGIGQPWQAQLRQYTRRHCSRGIIRGDARKLPHGGFLYFRDPEIVRELIHVHEHFVPTCTDEIAMTLLYRRMTGHWIDVEKWYGDGYSPFCYSTRKVCKQPEMLLFSEGLIENDVEAKLRKKITTE